MFDFSIIIAVKNKEKYITKTLLSCINQDIDPDKFEVIIVNDFSKDKTFNKIKKFKKQKLNIKIINNKRSYGPGIARNIALSKSNGKYVVFLDGDDELKKNCLITLYRYMKNNPDLIIFNFDKIKNREEFFGLRKDYSKINLNRNIMIKNFLRGEIDGSVIFTCFNKSFLIKNSIQFPKGLHEDITYIFQSYFHAKKIVKIKKSLYKKNEVSNSITGTLSKKRIEGLLNIHKKLIAFLIKKKKYFKRSKEDVFRGFVGCAIDTVCEIKDSKLLSKKEKYFFYNLINRKISGFPIPKSYIYRTKKDIMFKNYCNL